MPKKFRPAGDYRHLKVSTLKVKPDLQLSGSGSSQAMCNKIHIAPDMTIRTVQNTFSTVQLFHEYSLPEKPEVPTIC